MSDATEITFCLPVYNSAERVERCLRAVLAQAVPFREILVVDNCSTDDTVARVRRLLEGVPGTRIVVNEKNLGRIENWNRCLELATGRYLRFALVNDVMLPGSAEMLLQAARDQPGATMICSRLCQVVAVPELLQPAPTNPPTEVLDPLAALRRFSRQGNDTGGLGGMLVRTDVIRRDSLRFRTDIPFWSDFYLSIELADRGKTVYPGADSYLFDLGVKERFSYAGLKNYFSDGAICARAIADRLKKFGGDRGAAFEFLWRQYTSRTWNYQQKPLSPLATLKLFAGAGEYRARALGYVLTYRIRGAGQKCTHLGKRAAAKIGRLRSP